MDQAVKQLCSTPNCTRQHFIRGRCRCCYANYREAIKSGAITEADAVAQGLIDERKPAFGGKRYVNKRVKGEPWKVQFAEAPRRAK